MGLGFPVSPGIGWLSFFRMYCGASWGVWDVMSVCLMACEASWSGGVREWRWGNGKRGAF